jgi:phosphodiesterase/alkaline phosphatase D-like protein
VQVRCPSPSTISERQHELRTVCVCMKSSYKSRSLLVLVAALALSVATAVQRSPYAAKDIPPPAKNAARVQITKEPALEFFRNNEAIIQWTSNNPGGTDEHFGLVQYGTDPHHLNLTAKSHIRLNRNHSYTVFRVRVEGLQPGTTYYYTVHSIEADGTDDGLKSGVYRLTTPRGT